MCVVLFVLCSACTGGEARPPTDSLTAIARPIVDIAPAASMGEDGRPVDPALVFAPDTPEITVVVQVGELTGSPMEITWFQVSAEGEQELFTHTVEVASLQSAFSVGENPGALSPGAYRVQATLGGESLSTHFEVSDSEQTGAVGQGATVGPPSSGGSGAVGPPVAPGGTPGEPVLLTYLNYGPIDPNSDRIQLGIIAAVPGGGGRLEVEATMNGNTRALSLPTDESGLVNKLLDFRPCAHPGGSDLPGARVSFESVLYKGDAPLETVVDLTRLGPDTARPAVTLNVEPASGSRVEAGDRILFAVTAQEARRALSWQTGVRSLRVRAVPGEDLVPQVRADSDAAQPCSRKQWSLVSQGTYTVPDDPPEMLRICPLAIDFAGNQNADTCAVYFTTEVWTGSLRVDITDRAQAGTCVGYWQADVTIEVGDARTTATALITEAPVNSCGVTPFAIEGAEFPLVVEKSASGFTIGGSSFGILGLEGDLQVPFADGDRAATTETATYTSPFGESITSVVTIELGCPDCDEAVG